jgi:hypothetical protein
LYRRIIAHGVSSLLDCFCLLIQQDTPPLSFSLYTTFDHISLVGQIAYLVFDV